MNERVAEALHTKVIEDLRPNDLWIDRPPQWKTLADYTKKVLDHLVLLEEEVNDLHRRNHQLSRRLRAFQNRVDAARRKQK